MRTNKIVTNNKLFYFLSKYKFVFFSFLSALSLVFRLDLVNEEKLTGEFLNPNLITKLLVDIYHSLPGNSVFIMIIFFLLLIFYKYIAKISVSQKKKKYSCILSGLYTFFIVVGYSFFKTYSFDYNFSNYIAIIKSFIKFIGIFILIYHVIIAIFGLLENGNIYDNKYTDMSAKKYIKLGIAFCLCWLPYLLIFYPACTNGDTTAQLLQFFGYESSVTKYSSIVGDNIFITNHHPVLHTIIYGIFVKLGMIAGNDEWGVVFYAVIQMIIISSAFSYIIYFLEKKQINKKIVKWIKLFYAFFPLYGIYSVTMLKDPSFSIVCLMLCVMLYEIGDTNGSILKNNKFLALLFCCIMLFELTKNQGVYIIIIVGLILLCVYKKYLQRIGTVFITCIFLYQIVFLNIVLPHFNIAPGGLQEALSIPFQQTARYAKEWGDEVTSEEKAAIDKILPYEELKHLYSPTLSDPVKFRYNQQSTKQELLQYFRVWGKQFLKHPKTYFEATISNCFGFFYPDRKSSFAYYEFEPNLNKSAEIFSISNPSGTSDHRTFVKYVIFLFQKLPFFNLLFSIGFYTWIYIFCLAYFIFNKRKECIIAFLPITISILVCIASPANGNWRYMMPVIMSCPVFVALLFKRSGQKPLQIIKVENENKKVCSD